MKLQYRLPLLLGLVLGALPMVTSAAAISAQARGGQEQGAEKARGQQKPAQREQPDKAREKTQPQERGQADPARERPAERGSQQPPETGRESTGRDATEPDAGGRGNSRWAGRSKEDVARFKRYLAEEAKHRQRLARMERLRELARKSNSADRLEKLKELEAVEARRYEAAMTRFRTEMGDEDFRDAKAFVERFGTSRGRPNVDPARERAKDEKEEPAAKRPGAGGGQ